jgi:hypothetical protein
MPDVIGELASKSGISVDQAKKGLGAVLAAMRGALPAESFSRVQEAVPNAGELMEGAEESGQESSGGVLGAITSTLGKLFGGGESTALTKLAQAGFSAEQLREFLPNVLEFLKAKLPADVMERIGSLIPTSTAAGETDE